MTHCKYCDHDTLVEEVEATKVPFGDDGVMAEIRTSICTHCNRGQITSEQARANKRAINEAKRASLGLPSKVELQKMRLRWKMTQATAGTLFGVGTTAFCKYEVGEILPSAPTARLLYVASTDDHTMMSLVTKYGQGLKITPPAKLRERSASSLTIEVQAPVLLSVVIVIEAPLASGRNSLSEERKLSNTYFDFTDGGSTASAPQLQSPDQAASPSFYFPIALPNQNVENRFPKN